MVYGKSTFSAHCVEKVEYKPARQLARRHWELKCFFHISKWLFPCLSNISEIYCLFQCLSCFICFIHPHHYSFALVIIEKVAFFHFSILSDKFYGMLFPLKWLGKLVLSLYHASLACIYTVINSKEVLLEIQNIIRNLFLLTNFVTFHVALHVQKFVDGHFVLK